MARQSTLRGSGGQKQKSTSNALSGPSKKSKSGLSSRRASVLTEEEDEARLASEGVEFIEDEGEDGNITGVVVSYAHSSGVRGPSEGSGVLLSCLVAMSVDRHNPPFALAVTCPRD